MVDIFGNPFADQAREVQDMMHLADKGAHTLRLSEQELAKMRGAAFRGRNDILLALGSRQLNQEKLASEDISPENISDTIEKWEAEVKQENKRKPFQFANHGKHAGEEISDQDWLMIGLALKFAEKYNHGNAGEFAIHLAFAIMEKFGKDSFDRLYDLRGKGTSKVSCAIDCMLSFATIEYNNKLQK